ncbi:hypothetical protein L596_014243 [Steinernema carpocapsae]|uniref:Uncharacterized protein n=1 Tax=Steinernema carpocapsae TaxID=34508 RepID=A0A4V6A2R2_STECR|nr:hypothetical protein L596_014243 [Steinernema carpocapsae]
MSESVASAATSAAADASAISAPESGASSVKDSVAGKKSSAKDDKKKKRRKSSTLKRHGKRRKHKRNLEPEGFEQWPQKDQEFYRKVSAHLRNWKATCRQSRYIRTPITWWQMLRKAFKGHPMHALEMDAYKKTEATMAGISEKLKTLDLDFE